MVTLALIEQLRVDGIVSDLRDAFEEELFVSKTEIALETQVASQSTTRTATRLSLPASMRSLGIGAGRSRKHPRTCLLNARNQTGTERRQGIVHVAAKPSLLPTLIMDSGIEVTCEEFLYLALPTGSIKPI